MITDRDFFAYETMFCHCSIEDYEVLQQDNFANDNTSGERFVTVHDKRQLG